MKYTKFLLLFCAISLFIASCNVENVQKSEDFRYLTSKHGCVNNEWQFQYKGEWYPATVPGNIHDDLLKNQLIPDPFFGTNEDSVQWVSDSTWTYRLYFDKNCAEENDFGHEQLVFEGLDTYSEIYLNGERIKSVDGTAMPNNMFRQWAFDVADKLKDKDNELIVKFLPTAPMDSLGKAVVPFTMPDTRVFTRKAQYQSGWDWGPKLNTCGIWKNVYIRSWKLFKQDNLYVQDTKPTLDSNGVWACDVSFDLESEIDGKVKVLVEYYSTSPADSTAKRELVSKKVKVNKGANKISVPVQIEHPKLWWPNGMGDQNLYAFSVKISYKGKTYENYSSVNGGMVCHGLRTIALKREKDSIGESFAFVVNGKPCFMRGANWIPATSYPGCLVHPEGNDLYYNLLHDAKAVNMNMIRVWGGGLYEDDAFYNYCDQLGLLVWQDFMYACNPYPGDEAFLKNAKIEAKEQVCRLRNHPSVAVWCGNNEVHNGLEDWGWQTALNWTDEQNRKLYQDFNTLFEKILPEVVKEYAHSDVYVSSSPTYGWGHKECCTHGCSHYWGVWWGELPFEIYWEKTGRFMTEYGFQSYPEMATIETFTTEKDRTLDSPALKNHQKHGRGVAIIQQAMKNDFGYTRTDNLSNFAYVSQLVQVEGIAQAIDAHRIQRDRCQGTLYWQLNDCWPVASWSSIDYLGRWKALHYRLKDLYANIALMVHQNADQSLDFYLVNDDLKDMAGTVRYEVLDIHGNGKIAEGTIDNASVKTNSTNKVLTLGLDDLKAANPKDVCVKVQFVAAGKVLAQRVTYFVKPKDLNLTNSDIQMSVNYLEDRFEVTLKSPTLLYGVALTEPSGKMVKWSDNYFDLLPNETKTIVGYYDIDAEGKPQVEVTCFQNVR